MFEISYDLVRSYQKLRTDGRAKDKNEQNLMELRRSHHEADAASRTSLLHGTLMPYALWRQLALIWPQSPGSGGSNTGKHRFGSVVSARAE